jgi:hypothetical protein
MSKMSQFHAIFMTRTMTKLMNSQSNAVLKTKTTKKLKMQNQIHADNLLDLSFH